ncbi:TPA: gp58-like family protein, partial [Streptococcus suis]
SAGTVLNQINLLANGTNRIDGRLTHITGQTLIDNGVIKNAMIGELDAGKITSGTVDAARIKANSIDGSKIAFDEAFFNGLSANEAYLRQLFAKNAFITSVQAVSLSASNIVGGVLKATNGAIQMDLNNANITFNQNAAINFNSSNNAISRRRNGNTGFLKVQDSSGGGVDVMVGATSGYASTSIDTSKFAGLVARRDNDKSDFIELYGDYAYFKHSNVSKKLFIHTASLVRDYNLISILDKLIDNMSKLHAAGAFGDKPHWVTID